MYDLCLSGKDAEAFKMKVLIKMDEMCIDYGELADRTGYSYATIKKFFCKGQWNKFLAATIEEELFRT